MKRRNTATNKQLGVAGDYNEQVGMTLAEIAYAEPRYLTRQLAYRYYATKGQWALKWLGVSAGNQMYVAQNGAAEQWVVAIRGSMTDPSSEAFWIDWFEEDLQILETEPLPFANVTGALITWGAFDGFSDLISMKDAATGQTLLQFLSNNVVLDTLSIVVLGHSLGGCLASVLAPYLYEALCKPQNKPPDCIVPLSFAAPTAGNEQFSTYLENLFYGYPFRYVNDQDVAPHSWSLNGLDWVMNSYDPAPKISDFFYGLVDALWWVLYSGNYNYQQPGPPDSVAGQLQGYYWWFEEAGYQHAGETYLKLYGVPPVVFPYPPHSPLIGVIPRRQRPPIKGRHRETMTGPKGEACTNKPA